MSLDFNSKRRGFLSRGGALIASASVGACGEREATAVPVPPLAPDPHPTPTVAKSPFSTSFAGKDENPISENGCWTHGTDATYFHPVKVWGGHAVATGNASPSPPGLFDDSTARLTGSWAPDQEVVATVYRHRAVYNGEVEINLRVTDSPNSLKLYECLANVGGGVSIVRWNGPPGDITYLDKGINLRDPRYLNDGDRLRARVVGQTISFWYARRTAPSKWILIGSVTDDSSQRLTSGNPGMAFFKRADADPGGHFQLYGFKDFAAVEL